MKYKYIILVTMFLISTNSLMAAQGQSAGLIKGYVINEAGFFVTPEGGIASSISGENINTCNVTARFVIAHNKNHTNAFISTILTAFQTKTKLRLFGTGDCSSTASSNSEELRKICTMEGPC